MASAWVLIGSEIQSVSLANQMTNTSAIYKYVGTESGYKQNELYYHDGTAWRLVSPVDEELTETVQNLTERVNDLAGVFATTSTGYYGSGGTIIENSGFCHTPKISASRFLPPIDINGNSLVSAIHSVVVFNNGVGSSQISWANTESYDQPFDEIGYTFYSNIIPTGTTVYFDTGTFTLVEAERRIDAIETGMASFWYDKELSFIGDSIVAGVYSGDGGGVTTETFCKICGEVLGAQKVNSYGYSGVAIYGTNGICTRVSNITTDSDLVVVAAGTNDYAQNVPLGVIADTTNISFYGALYVMCDALMNRFPGKRIVFVTPINKWSEGANTAGYTLQQYRDAIKEVAADTFGFGVVNGREMGLTYKNASIYLSDGIHPTLLGHKIYGESLAHALNAK